MKKKLFVFAAMLFLFGGVKANAASFYAEDPVYYDHFISTGQWVTKNTWNTQQIHVVKAQTDFTNPCKNCQFIVRTHDYYGHEGALGSIIKLYQTKSFIGHDGSSQPGQYKLKIKRSDFTLLTTTFGADWIYD